MPLALCQGWEELEEVVVDDWDDGAAFAGDWCLMRL